MVTCYLGLSTDYNPIVVSHYLGQRHADETMFEIFNRSLQPGGSS